MKIRIKNITLMEEVETEEAEEILEEAKEHYKLLKSIPLYIFLGFLAMSIISIFFIVPIPINSSNMVVTSHEKEVVTPQLVPAFVICLWILTIFSLIALIICSNIYANKLKPFYRLLEIAKMNDKIRHEERIREKERQRLRSNKGKQEFLVNDVENTINKNNMYQDLVELEEVE